VVFRVRVKRSYGRRVAREKSGRGRKRKTRERPVRGELLSFVFEETVDADVP
jgi:hypothetical protein